MVTGAVSGWTTCDTNTVFCTTVTVFNALQETGNWTTSAMSVPRYIVCGRDHGGTATWCSREVSHFHRSWVDHERCTAILVESSMLLSVCMPHSGRDEEDYIEPLGAAKNITAEGEKTGAVDFYIGGDINIEI